MAAAETDTHPLLLPPPATDDPPPFDSHAEFYTPAAHQRARLQSAPSPVPPHSSAPRGSPTNPFRPPQSTLNHQTLPRHSTDTDDNASLLPAYTPARYRGHATEEEYLAALRAWAEEKLYTQPADKSTLVGFYGAETMKERIARQPPPLKMRIGRKRKEGRDGESAGHEAGGVGREGVGERGDAEKEGRRRNWLSRKRTN